MLIDKIRKFLKIRSDEDRMNTFLSQAQNAVHLEQLQREWDKMSCEQKRCW